MKQVILMADIVKSSDQEGGALMDVFSGLVDQVNSQFAKNILSPMTITLGDEFQGVVDTLSTAAEIIFEMDEQCLCSVPAFRLRYVIQWGEIDTPVNRSSAHGMLGKGLTSAREQLDNMKKGDQEITVRGYDGVLGDELGLAFQLYRAFYNDWPEKDRMIAFDFIHLRDYKILAEQYNKDASTMWRKERSLRMKDFYASRSLIKLLTEHAGNHH